MLRAGDLRRDEERLLKEHNYGFLALTRHDVTLSQHFAPACRCTLMVEAIFCLGLAAFLVQSRPLSLLCGSLALALLAVQAAALAVLAVSVVAGKLHKRQHRKSVLYWSWWHLCTLPLSLIAALSAAVLGHWLWHASLKHYYELDALQKYPNVDPAIVPGDQVQDAGVVSFTSTEPGTAVGVDRSKAGCFVNGGTTYCVAPIVQGGRLRENFAGFPRFGSYDYFAVGVDCCDCPVQEFRCGAWEDPLAHGGLRSMDVANRPLFRLAVDQWKAAYGKVSAHPLFFDWVHAPMLRWREYWSYVVHTSVLVACAVVPVTFCVALLLQRLRGALEDRGLLSPVGVPVPPPGLRKAWQLLLPQLLQQHEEEQRQQLPPGLPHWYRSLLLPSRERPEAQPGLGEPQDRAPRPPPQGWPATAPAASAAISPPVAPVRNPSV